MSKIPMSQIPVYTHICPLHPWQQLVVDEVKKHDEFLDSEAAQGLNDFTLNKSGMIQVSMRAGAGHTCLAAHFAKNFNATIVYFDVEHYKEMEGLADARGTDEGFGDSMFVSIFELRHDILLSSKSAWISDKLDHLRKKFAETRDAIVIDRATEVREKFPEVIDFICQVTRGVSIVLLG